MSGVDFIYDPGCPNVAQARANLRAAFAELGAEPEWLEWDTTDPATPDEFRSLPSPAIWVDGRDVDPSMPSASGYGCRIYVEGDASSGVPSVALLVQALGNAKNINVMPTPASPSGGGRWRRALAVLPSLGVATVPVGLCPVCFAGYLGVFSAVGLGFLLERRYLLPLAAMALLLALASLAWRAPARWGYGPLAVGAAGALLLWLGQFVLGNVVAIVLGAVALGVAAAWNVWPRRDPARACSACAPRTRGPSSRSPS
ncbi:hypothetical protein [Lysobacter sp. D1-1-M9]|uniref:hypothetical protein n=1 Tax=Novilysobacter longmucuonensis TaxID=3098603 RepID=UPI002FC6DFBE